MGSKSNNQENRRTSIQVTDGTLIPERGEKSLFSAWRITVVGAVSLLILIPVIYPFSYSAEKSFFENLIDSVVSYKDLLWFLSDGLLMTLVVTIVSIGIALIIGLFTGLGRISRNTVINRIATVYVEVIRGIPLLVQLFYIYYGITTFIKLSAFSSAIIAMSVCYGAYMGEIFRAGIQAIPKGQMEAALALGLSRAQALRMIVLPQTLRIILPPIGNEFIAMLKDSSLVSVIAIADLLRRGKEYTSVHFNTLQTFTVVALIYLVMTLILSRLVAIMEERMTRREHK